MRSWVRLVSLACSSTPPAAASTGGRTSLLRGARTLRWTAGDRRQRLDVRISLRYPGSGGRLSRPSTRAGRCRRGSSRRACPDILHVVFSRFGRQQAVRLLHGLRAASGCTARLTPDRSALLLETGRFARFGVCIPDRGWWSIDSKEHRMTKSSIPGVALGLILSAGAWAQSSTGTSPGGAGAAPPTSTPPGTPSTPGAPLRPPNATPNSPANGSSTTSPGATSPGTTSPGTGTTSPGTGQSGSGHKHKSHNPGSNNANGAGNSNSTSPGSTSTSPGSTSTSPGSTSMSPGSTSSVNTTSPGSTPSSGSQSGSSPPR